MTQIALKEGQSDEQRITCLKKIEHSSTYLLENALKYSKTGGHVWLIVRETNGKSGFSHLSFQVKDDGIGIAPSISTNVPVPFSEMFTGFTIKKFLLG